MTDATVDTGVETGAVESPEPELVHGAPTITYLGQQVVFPAREQYLDVVKALRGDGFEMCVDLTGVDYLVHPVRPEPLVRVDPERFDAVLAAGDARPAEMRGRELRGWVVLDANALRTDRELARWVELGIARARSLPGKP